MRVKFGQGNIGRCLLYDLMQGSFGDLFALGDHEGLSAEVGISTKFDMATFLALRRETKGDKDRDNLLARQVFKP